MSPEIVAFIVIFVLLETVFILTALKTIREDEAAIIYAQEKPMRLAKPGIVFVLPIIQKMEKFKTPLEVADWANGKGNVIIDYKTFPAVSDEQISRGDKVIPVELVDGHIKIRK